MIRLVVFSIMLGAVFVSDSLAVPTTAPVNGSNNINADDEDRVTLESSFNLDLKEEYEKLSFNELRAVPPNVTVDVPKWVDEWTVPPEIRKWFPFYITGYDEDGSPVYVIEFGRYKITEALREGPGGRESMRRLLIRFLEQGTFQALRDGFSNDGQGIGCILDFDGFSIANLADPIALDLGLRQFQALSQMYHVLKYAFLINTNFAAENLIGTVKPFVGTILDKCEVFGTQRAKWLPHLVRRIPRNQLPPWYGGDEDWRPVWVGGSPRNATIS